MKVVVWLVYFRFLFHIGLLLLFYPDDVECV